MAARPGVHEPPPGRELRSAWLKAELQAPTHGRRHHKGPDAGRVVPLLEGQASPRQLAALIRALGPAYALIEQRGPELASSLGATGFHTDVGAGELAEQLGRPASADLSLYVTGATPNSLNPSEQTELWRLIGDHVDLAPDPEARSQ